MTNPNPDIISDMVKTLEELEDDDASVSLGLIDEELLASVSMKTRTTMPRYRKKPVEIEAIQYTRENRDECVAFSGARHMAIDDDLEIETLEGTMRARLDDWIIKGVKGEFYPCRPDIFEATYEAV